MLKLKITKWGEYEKVFKKVELLSPAGSFEKGMAALRYGADAIYFGLKGMNLRAFASNLTENEAENLIDFAHGMGKKVYVTLNIFPYDEDFSFIGKYSDWCEKYEVDGVIVSDPGVVYFLNHRNFKIPIHLSTQANSLNSFSAKFWRGNGVNRIILARELNLKQIKRICEKNRDMEFEVFIHGALCISYSGRCFLSKYLSGRDGNRGECVQCCRWKYKIKEIEKGEEWLDVFEEERGTYIFNSKDLKTIEILPEILDTGVASLKIEGRMRSLYYVSLVTSIYRRGIDAIYEKGRDEFYRLLPEFERELQKISTRGYTTNFLKGEPDFYSYSFDEGGVKKKESFVGILRFRLSVNSYLIEVKNSFGIGDNLEIIMKDGSIKSFPVYEIVDFRGNVVDKANSGLIYKIKTDGEYPLNVFLRKVSQ